MNVNWWLMKCKKCAGGSDILTVVIHRVGFDKNWTLHIEGICRFCFTKVVFSHTRQEQVADVREAFNLWKAEGKEDASDFKDWEIEIGGKDDCSD